MGFVISRFPNLGELVLLSPFQAEGWPEIKAFLSSIGIAKSPNAKAVGIPRKLFSAQKDLGGDFLYLFVYRKSDNGSRTGTLHPIGAEDIFFCSV